MLRKDFILDPWQVYESRAMGADCILLILAALSDEQARELESLARALDMDVLAEVHDRGELDRALGLQTPMIGINNRNLKTLKTRLETTLELAPHVPPERFLVAESGIRTADRPAPAGRHRGAVLPGRRDAAAPARRGRRGARAAGGRRPGAVSGGLTHLDARGRAAMVDVSDKPATAREATARARVAMRPETLALILAGDAAKGDVLGAARIAGIMAAKRTAELIPLCHPLPIASVRVELEPRRGRRRSRSRRRCAPPGRRGWRWRR